MATRVPVSSPTVLSAPCSVVCASCWLAMRLSPERGSSRHHRTTDFEAIRDLAHQPGHGLVGVDVGCSLASLLTAEPLVTVCAADPCFVRIATIGLMVASTSVTNPLA